jgi:hypothetical protein
MKTKLTVVLAVVLLLGLGLPGIASARGLSPAQLTRAGWLCVNAGAEQWVHCFQPGAFANSATMHVMVFDTLDVTATEADFLGTELLLRADLFNGQPCPQEGGEYTFLPSFMSGLPVDYYYCHHFDTTP